MFIFLTFLCYLICINSTRSNICSKTALFQLCMIDCHSELVCKEEYLSVAKKSLPILMLPGLYTVFVTVRNVVFPNLLHVYVCIASYSNITSLETVDFRFSQGTQRNGKSLYMFQIGKKKLLSI